MRATETKLVVIFPPSADLSDLDYLEREIDSLDLDRIIICGGGSARPKEAEDGHGR
jgi:hypothetical protein